MPHHQLIYNEAKTTVEWIILLDLINSTFLDLINPKKSLSLPISDQNRGYMKRCELMVRILCHTTMLKGDDCRLRRATYAEKMCILCEIGGVEDAKHITMQCHPKPYIGLKCPTK